MDASTDPPPKMAPCAHRSPHAAITPIPACRFAATAKPHQGFKRHDPPGIPVNPPHSHNPTTTTTPPQIPYPPSDSPSPPPHNTIRPKTEPLISPGDSPKNPAPQWRPPHNTEMKYNSARPRIPHKHTPSHPKLGFQNPTKNPLGKEKILHSQPGSPRRVKNTISRLTEDVNSLTRNPTTECTTETTIPPH